jgi:hypothetical protein
MPCNINLFQEQADIEAKKRKDILIKSIDESLNELKRFSTQIFLFRNSKLIQIGSGFYFRHEDRLLIISAAHVFDDEPENKRFVFNDEGNLKQVTGTLHKHITSGKRDDDLKDIIAIEISNMSRNDVIESNMIDLQVNYQHGLYAFLGYPSTKNGVVYKEHETKSRAYSYFDVSLKAIDVKSFQYDDSLNILIRYQHKETITNGVGPNKSVSMKGISGGPVFWIAPMNDLSSWNKDQIKLAGVVIHTVEGYEYMAAARIKVLVDYLTKNQPDFQTIKISSDD